MDVQYKTNEYTYARTTLSFLRSRRLAGWNVIYPIFTWKATIMDTDDDDGDDSDDDDDDDNSVWKQKMMLMLGSGWCRWRRQWDEDDDISQRPDYNHIWTKEVFESEIRLYTSYYVRG